MSRRLAAAAATTALSIGLVAAYGLLSNRTPDRGPAETAPEQVAALQRDLKLDAGQASARMAADTRAAKSMPALRAKLGDAYGGAWFDDGSMQLVVAVTDGAMAPTVKAAGAQPKVVARSAAQLDDLKARLDRNAAQAPAMVTGWHVDVVTNSVVVVAGADTSAVKAFVAGSGVAPGAVRVMVAKEQPRTKASDVRGGDLYAINGEGFCSVGFSVVGGFVTAGHCGKTGDRTTAGKDDIAQGTFVGSSFPGTNDYGWVRVNKNWTPRGVVNNYKGGTVRVAGSQEAAVGSAVCRSGSTTGWHCGRILARNATVRYAEGMVTGLTRTNVCAEPGDSGGAWVTGNQAQGVTSGGSGDCTDGGMTYFQPVNEILSRYGLKLITSTPTQ